MVDVGLYLVALSIGAVCLLSVDSSGAALLGLFYYVVFGIPLVAATSALSVWASANRHLRGLLFAVLGVNAATSVVLWFISLASNLAG